MPLVAEVYIRIHMCVWGRILIVVNWNCAKVSLLAFEGGAVAALFHTNINFYFAPRPEAQYASTYNPPVFNPLLVFQRFTSTTPRRCSRKVEYFHISEPLGMLHTITRLQGAAGIQGRLKWKFQQTLTFRTHLFENYLRLIKIYCIYM